MKNQYKLILLITFLFLITETMAQIPKTLDYQGRLADSGGTPVPDGNYSVTFRIYNVASGGSALWTEAQTVSTTRGLFAVALGKIITLNLAFDTTYWLGISIGVNPEMTPRVELTSAPYCLNADKLDGIDSSAFAPLASPTFTGNVTLPSGIWNSSGNVGIGTASPVNRLDVTGTVKIGLLGFVTDYAEVLFNAYHNGISKIYTVSDSAFSIIHDRSIDSLNFMYAPPGTDGSTVGWNYGVSLTSNGKVGIGTASPTQGDLVVFGTAQNASRITLSGQEFYQPDNTSTDGVALLLGVNRSGGNKQLWIADSANLAQNSTNRALVIGPGGISAVATDGVTHKSFALNASPLMLNGNGANVGIGTASPSYPLEVATANGAHVTSGGAWTNGSSREYKKDITYLTTDEAVAAMHDLHPVKFTYKDEPDERYVGFIAEDVPDLVATKDRKGLSPMDITAVLTKVVQTQQQQLEQQAKEIATLKNELDALKLDKSVP